MQRGSGNKGYYLPVEGPFMRQSSAGQSIMAYLLITASIARTVDWADSDNIYSDTEEGNINKEMI
jgi:hypothetical protein